MEWSPFADRPASNAGSFFSLRRQSLDAGSVESLRFSDAESQLSNKRPPSDMADEPAKRQSLSAARSTALSRVSNVSSGLFCTPKPSPFRAPLRPVAGPSRPPHSLTEASDYSRPSPLVEGPSRSVGESSISRPAPSIFASSFSITPPPLVYSPSSFHFDRPSSRQSSHSLGTRSRVILAFDFGTGYSSASYVLIEPGPTEVHSILPKLTEEDDPFADSDGDNASESSFDSLELRHDRNELYRWGHSVHQAWLEVSTIQFKKFKLLLQDNDETADVREMLRRDLETLASRARSKTQIDLIIDFLTTFVAHVKKMLDDAGIYSGTDK
ncbi:hypothetical protein PG997_011434 [Apiospora hydei]|uniref:Uncharacterized protein n=1 Tax=Apiospora hydei TaxID=1337664 RepID=A0ABR1VJ12_9PEZI